MNKCSEYIDLMQKELDGNLTELEKKKLQKHVQQCPSCSEEYAEFMQLGELLDGFAMEEPPIALKEMVMTEILATEDIVTEVTENKIFTHLSVGIAFLILAAGLNAIFFLAKLIPFMGMENINYRNVIFYQIFFKVFGKFVAIGSYLGDTLKLVLRSFIQTVPWTLILFSLALIPIFMICLWSLYRLNKKGGDLT